MASWSIDFMDGLWVVTQFEWTDGCLAWNEKYGPSRPGNLCFMHLGWLCIWFSSLICSVSFTKICFALYFCLISGLWQSRCSNSTDEFLHNWCSMEHWFFFSFGHFTSAVIYCYGHELRTIWHSYFCCNLSLPTYNAIAIFFSYKYFHVNPYVLLLLWYNSYCSWAITILL